MRTFRVILALTLLPAALAAQRAPAAAARETLRLSMEDAVRREIKEEAGVPVGEVKYMASQPWPFPTSLMIGCHAEALSRDIVVDRTELEDARWFSKDEIVSMLLRNHPDGLTTPPPVAIAHHIIRAWVEDGIEFD